METFKHCFGLVLLAIVIHGFDFGDLEKKLNKMARKGEKIHELFKLMESGTINRGGHGFVFKGVNIDDNRPVALKFVPLEERNKADIEFKMYGYLNAINSSNVEKYGISSLYYYQEWEDFMVSALPFFDGGDLSVLSSKGYFHHKNASLAINSLILLRDFVMHSKYIHSQGITHNSIKPANLVVQKSSSRTFLIDFTSSSKMLESHSSGTWPYIPKLVLTDAVSTPKSEWESFVYLLADIIGIELGWLFGNPFAGPDVSEKDAISEATRHLINNTDRTISVIEKAPIASPVLKRVFVLFAKEALTKQFVLPAYNDIYERINREIAENFRSQYFTWLDNNQGFCAEHDHGRCHNIRDVPDVPMYFREFNYTEYPLDFFPKPTLKKRLSSLFRCSNCS